MIELTSDPNYIWRYYMAANLQRLYRFPLRHSVGFARRMRGRCEHSLTRGAGHNLSDVIVDSAEEVCILIVATLKSKRDANLRAPRAWDR